MEPVNLPDEILHGQGDLTSGANQIRSTPEREDSPHNLPILSTGDIEDLLQRALLGEVTLDGVRDWADAIEGRIDLVQYENRGVGDLLFELGTPPDDELTRWRVEELLREITSKGRIK